MAQQADGTVYIDTLLDTTGFKAGGKDVEAAVRRMSKTVSGIGATAKIALQKQTDAFVKANQAYAQQEQKVEALKNKLKEMSEQKVATDEFKEIGKQIDNDTAKLNRLEKAQEEFLAVGGKESSSAYRRREMEIEELRNSIKYAKGEQEDLLNTGGAYKAVDTSGVEQKLFNEEQRLQNMNNSLATSYASLKNKVDSYSGSAINLASVKERLGKSFSSLLSAVKKTAKSIGGTLLSGVKKLGTAMLGLNKVTKNTRMSMGRMLAMSLLFSTVFRAISTVASGIKEGFTNLAQYSSSVNASISSLMSALTQLKNSFATAFAPILNVVAPLITAFINMISKAVTYVGMFIAALTGQKTFTKAVAVQQDYAASLGDTSKGIKDTTKATKKAEKETEDYLSGLDEIRRWESPDKSDADSTGVGAGGGGGYAAPTPAEMFETVPIENSLKDLADKIRGFFKSENWQGLGEFIADGLNRGMEKVKQAISWDNVGPSVTHFVDAFTTTLNSLVDNFNWELLGQTVGTGVNTIVNTINLLADSINWKNIGLSIAEGFNGLFDTVNPQNLGKLLSQKIRIAIETAYGFVTTFKFPEFGMWTSKVINGFFNNIDFGLLAKTLSTGIIGALNSIATAIEQVNWYGIGKKVQDFLVNINWSGIFNALFEVIGAALGGLALFIWGIIEDAWNSVVNWFKEATKEGGWDAVKGLFNGIVEALKNVGSWIKQNIFDPFIQGFKKAFGIASPSKVMEEQGKFLMQGLFNGISSLIGNVVSIFTTIKEKISGVWDSIKTTTLNVWNNIKSTLSNVWNEIKSKISDAWNNIKNNTINAWNNIKTNISNIWSGIKNTASTIFDGIKSTVSNAWNNVNNTIGNLKNAFNSIKQKASDTISNIISLFRNIRLPSIPLPHFTISTKKISFLGTSFSLPTFKVNWYAKGGLFDQPSMIGVGEAGKEAVLPLENRKTMSAIANSIVANMPKPYLASGAVVPPKAQYSTISIETSRQKEMDDMYSMMRDVLSKIEQAQSKGSNIQTIRIPVVFNGRQVFEAVIDEAKMKQMVSGRNPFEMA